MTEFVSKKVSTGENASSFGNFGTFSRDGKRLYFNKAVGNNKSQVYCVDLSSVVD